MSWTLSVYVARRFLSAFGAAFAVVLLIAMLIDMVEISRAGSNSDVGLPQFVTLALLHAPIVTYSALPFTALIAAMACFARLARSSELVVTRAAGVSVWQLLAPPVLAAALIGAAAFAVYNPIAAATLERYEVLKARYFNDVTSLLSVSETGLWLRQSGANGGQTVIHARRSSNDGSTLWDVTLHQFDRDDRLTGRIEADRMVLTEGAWRLYRARRWKISQGAIQAVATELDSFDVPTELTQDQIVESFAQPEAISFWKLPRFIHALEKSGFSAARHRMHWQAQLALPLLFAAMVLIGASFSMRHVRFGGLGVLALGCVTTGIGYYFMANVSQALGASGAIAAPVAAWTPPLAATLIAIGLLLHLEDG